MLSYFLVDFFFVDGVNVSHDVVYAFPIAGGLDFFDVESFASEVGCEAVADHVGV